MTLRVCTLMEKTFVATFLTCLSKFLRCSSKFLRSHPRAHTRPCCHSPGNSLVLFFLPDPTALHPLVTMVDTSKLLAAATPEDRAAAATEFATAVASAGAVRANGDQGLPRLQHLLS
jgi:hypothetical protein